MISGTDAGAWKAFPDRYMEQSYDPGANPGAWKALADRYMEPSDGTVK